MEVKHYETVFILTPVLSDVQMKDTVDKFNNILKENGATIDSEENWGLKKLAYPIQKKTTGFYHLVQYSGSSKIVAALELEFRRDERILRFLTTALDRHALEFNDKRRKGEFNKKKETEEKVS
jgi:small subunit ribosomal protein S6